MSAPGSSWTSPPKLQVRGRMALRRRQNLRQQVPRSTTASKRLPRTKSQNGGFQTSSTGVAQNL
jgi:hypothetical protein